MIKIIIFTILILSINFLFNKYKLLPNYSGNNHQKFTNEINIPLSGGIYLFFIFIFLFNQKTDFIFFCFLILTVGILSDKNFIISPKLRFFLQFVIVTGFVIFLDLLITNIRIIFLDQLLSFQIISIIFSIFCILIIVNGANFIDGLNGLLLGYFLIVLFILFKLNFIYEIIEDKDDIIFLLLSVLLLLFFNYLNLFFLGDGGSYLIGLFLSYLLINIYDLNSDKISPFFIALLLWYPAFENLFSIIRKSNKRISPIEADKKHFHHLIFILFQKSFDIKKKYLNTFSSIMINFCNLIIFLIASLHPENSIFQIKLIGASVILYLIVYVLLRKKLRLIFKKK